MKKANGLASENNDKEGKINDLILQGTYQERLLARGKHKGMEHC
jgi:hypothetical protein